MELLVPKIEAPALKMPSYVKLAMAFGVGAGASLFDKSRYRSHGAITGAAWAAGLHGYCLDFNPAIPGRVVIPAAYTQLDFTSEDFSIITRAYFDAFPEIINTLFIRGWVNLEGYQFYVRDTGFLNITTNGPAGVATRSLAGEIVLGNWYTLGVSRSGASCRVFINGLDRSNAIGVHANPITSARSAKIGCHDNLTAWMMDGKMEFLRIFGGIALTASEHLAWHNALA